MLGTSLQNEHNIVLGPVWFFLALFWCRLIYRFLAQRTDTAELTLLIFVITAGLVVINRYSSIYQIPYEFTQGMVGMFYYHIGAVLKCRNGMTIEHKTAQKAFVVSVSFIVLLCVLVYYKLNGTNMNLSALKYPLLPFDLINAIGLVVTLYIFAENVARRNWCNRLIRFVAWFGESSMVVYFIHCIEYHFTIPFISHFVGTSEGPMKYMIGIGNPIIQVLICVICLLLYEYLKGSMTFISQRP